MKLFQPKTFTVFKTYKTKDYISDIIAGIIVAIIALPLSIALAIASGATPETGLFTAIIAGFVTSLLGGSRVNITGPTAAFATIVAGIILTQGMDGLFLATIMAGIILIIMGLLRVGSLIKYIPHTITVGFTSGIAVTLAIGQLKDFFGLTYPSGTVAIETTEKIGLIIEHFSTINPWALCVGILGLLILIFLPKIKFLSKVPASLIAVIVGALVCIIPFVSANTIGSLYTISSGLPKFNLPVITGERILSLLPNAFTIALLAGIESLLSCVVSDKMINDKHNSNTELIALGTSNLLVGFFGGIPATGAIARTAANVKNGGKSPLSGMVHAIVLLLVLVILMPLASYIPMPIIASILIMVAYNMSEWRQFVAIIKSKKWNDILVLVLTFALTVIFDLVKAIAVGLIVHYLIVLIRFIIEKRKAKKVAPLTTETEVKEEPKNEEKN
ncbi:MAG: sodium-independent anion transporter [Clostridiales bacterium]|nr:sodium-independent anion transporter [Clostridiales bacterium]